MNRSALFKPTGLFLAVTVIFTPALAAQSTDALPTGAILFFDLTDCPDGWELFDDGAGRFVLPLPSGGVNGTLYGQALADMEDRQHDHGFSKNFKPKEQSYAAAGGGTNLAKRKKYKIKGTTGDSSSGVPYIQYLVCEKAADSDGTQDEIPSGFLMFFSDPSGVGCPDDFSEPEELGGRVLTGVPQNGTPGLAVGGEPLESGEPSHKHTFSGKALLEPKVVAIASGCCNGGFAKSKEYDYEGTTDSTDVLLPYIELLACQKD